MDERIATTVPAPVGRSSDWSLILLLLLLTTAMRLWQVYHTEVVSRDTLTYIRIAWQLEHGNVRAVLRASPHHPGFPATVLAMSWLVRPLAGDLAFAMQLSAQLASVVAGILLVVPMYWLGREFFDRRVCFWAVLLFQCLPAGSQVLADGLSESFFLLCAATSLLFATRALRCGSWPGLAVAGLLGGIAYLTRPEGGLLVAATGLVLLFVQLRPRFRTGWGRFLVRAASLSVPALAVSVPYMLTIGHLTNKMAGDAVIRSAPAERPAQPVSAARPPALASLPHGVWWTWGPEVSSVWALREMFQIMARAFFYVLWLPALIGVWCYRDRLARVPGAWVMLLFNLTLLLALFRVAVLMGYLSERHMLFLVLSFSFWTVAGLDVLAGWLARAVVRCRPSLTGTRWVDGQTWALALLLLATTSPLIKALKPLHGNRIGFRDAGYWLAQHSNPDGPLLDPFGWTEYYAGRVFHQPLPGTVTATVKPPRYVVIDESDNKHRHLEGWAQAARAIKAGHGQPVHSWTLPPGKVVLYEVSLRPNWDAH